MPQIDKGLMFCDGQAFTADGLATYSISLTTARQIFQGEPLVVMIKVDVAADFTTGDELYEFQVQSDDNAAISSGTVIAKRAIVATTLAINTLHSIPVPQEVTQETYIGLYLDVTGTTPTITFTAWLGAKADVPAWQAIADGITIS